MWTYRPQQILTKCLESKRKPQQIKSNLHIGNRRSNIILVGFNHDTSSGVSGLTHTADKASPENKDAANKQFQEIAFEYAILSDERRRRRYDNTGNTSEALDLDDDDFHWTDFFRDQYANVLDGEALEKVKKDYQGSDEERRDLLAAFETHEGDMDKVYEDIMCSNVLDDDERFRRIIDHAIAAGEVKGFKTYAKETKVSKRRRVDLAKKEEKEAMELADELGVKEKLFGNGSSKKKKNSKKDDEASLAALIQQRQKLRSERFLDNLEAKYGGGKKSKRMMEEPPEEAFQKTGERLKKPRPGKA